MADDIAPTPQLPPDTTNVLQLDMNNFKPSLWARMVNFFKTVQGRIIAFTVLFVIMGVVIIQTSGGGLLKGDFAAGTTPDNAQQQAVTDAAQQQAVTDAAQQQQPAPDNKIPNQPTWKSPTAGEVVALDQIGKKLFQWEASDPDGAPQTQLNFQWAVVPGAVIDPQKMKDILKKPEASAISEYKAIDIVQWHDTAKFANYEKAINQPAGTCVKKGTDGNDAWFCSQFQLLPEQIAQFKEGETYTAIVMANDGAAESETAAITFSAPKPPLCADGTYFVKDKDATKSGCKKIPNYKGAIGQADFICGLYGTINNAPDDYRLSDKTKADLKTNIEQGCGKKPVNNICQTKMMYQAVGETTCKPLPIMSGAATQPLDALCETYTKEKDNASLSPDTKKVITDALANQCKPEPTEEAPPVLGIKTPVQANAGQTDNTTNDQQTALPQETLSQNTTTCPAGQYPGGASIPQDCKSVPNLLGATKEEMISACNTYKEILVGYMQSKMDPQTFTDVEQKAANVVCTTMVQAEQAAQAQQEQQTLKAQQDAAAKAAAEQQAAQAAAQAAAQQAVTQATEQPAGNTEPPPTLDATTSTAANAFETLPTTQTQTIAPLHPVAGNKPRSTSNTGPELWIYGITGALSLFGSRRLTKHIKK